MEDVTRVIDCGLIYENEPDGSCSDCDFMIFDENECIAPFTFAFPCTGSWYCVGEASEFTLVDECKIMH